MEKEFLTKNKILKGYGYYTSNTGYLKSNDRYDKSIPLVVGESLIFLGFKVEIIEVSNDYIVINVYKNEFIEKKDDEFIYDYVFKYKHTIKDTLNFYIEKYSYTSGRNEDFQIDSAEFYISLNEKAFEIYPDVRLVVLVHLYGVPGKIDEIKAICAKHNALLLEDAAESFGASYKGVQTGKFGDYSAISFNGNKIITKECCI